MLCVPACPAAFSLEDLAQYGGPNYPGAAASAPSFYSTFKTVSLADRCFPTRATKQGQTRALCAQPSCLNATLRAALGYSPNCTRISTLPSVTTAWVIDGAAQRSQCDLEVREVSRQDFEPVGESSTTQEWTSRLAKCVTTLSAPFNSPSPSPSTLT